MAGFYGRTGILVEDTLTGGLEKIKSYVQEAVYAAVMAGGQVVQKRAMELCPVSPGLRGHGADGSHMVDHIEVQVYRESQGASARIGVFNTAIIPYAPHVEFGPNGRPFLRPAIDETRDEVHKVMKETFDSELAPGFSTRTAVRFRGVA